MKGFMRFGKKGKLSSRYSGLYRIAKRIWNVAYDLEIPSRVRNSATDVSDLHVEEVYG